MTNNKRFINVRGCNGSGKTTLLRMLAAQQPCEVRSVDVPDHKPIPYTLLANNVAILGDYSTATQNCTTAGCDRIKTQKAVKDALSAIPADIVVFEGVIVSTIFQPWLDWSYSHGNGLVWAFLDTPLKVCLERIQARNGGKEINETLVADKHAGIQRVKDKALEAGEIVTELNHLDPLTKLQGIINDLKKYATH